MWIALYVNCVRGKFIPKGPFSSQEEAKKYCLNQDQPDLWEAMEVSTP